MYKILKELLKILIRRRWINKRRWRKRRKRRVELRMQHRTWIRLGCGIFSNSEDPQDSLTVSSFLMLGSSEPFNTIFYLKETFVLAWLGLISGTIEGWKEKWVEFQRCYTITPSVRMTSLCMGRGVCLNPHFLLDMRYFILKCSPCSFKILGVQLCKP